jgi:hypothetical protein
MMLDCSAKKIPRHGATVLPRVCVNSYNTELRDERGFVGDRANKRAFQAGLDKWRNKLGASSNDPLDSVPTSELYKDKHRLQEVLLTGDAEAAGLLLGAIEDYAQELAKVVNRLLTLDGWQRTEPIAVGGGFREGRVGELAIGRASVLLKSMGRKLDLVPIHHHPDDAGLIGCTELMAPDVLCGRSNFLAIDIGGTNFRTGIVAIDGVATKDPPRGRVAAREVWRHADERPTRDEAVRQLAEMLGRLLRRSGQERRDLAPYLGIACPGQIAPDGRIKQGAQNLPGGWDAADFNLPRILHDLLSADFSWDALVLMHNDAVVQGLGEVPFMADVEHWGMLTIGTGLGNAHFTNR